MSSLAKIFISHVAVLLSRGMSCKSYSYLRLCLEKTMLVLAVFHSSLLHCTVSSSVMWVVSAAQCWVAVKLKPELSMSKILVVSSK